jgi:pimeloyl-ACP methyl ester carboxylesterase
MQIIVDGLLTHYERTGKGRKILILPGWADTSVSWILVQKALSSHYDVLVMDIPGFGGSQPSAEAWGLNEYSSFIASFLEKLGIGDLYAVIGHSNGGAMAIRALGTDRMQSQKLVLVASAGIRAERQGRKGMLHLMTKTGKVLSKPLPKTVKQKLRSKLYSSIGSDMLVAEHMQETFKRIVSDDVQADAPNITIPTLLIYGDKDDETPVRYGETLYKLIQNSDLQVLPSADHFVHVHESARLSERIAEFLQ